MKSRVESLEEEISAVRLHLELKDEHLMDYHKRMMIRYGESPSGDCITRDILIPSDMPLHNLHYTIQKLFGWRNSHLRNFSLPDEIFEELTGGMVGGWAALVGILFQAPSQGEYDLFWDDDYERGNFNTWLKRKYTGPYVYEGAMEIPLIARNDVQELLKRFNKFEVKESFSDYISRKEKDPNTEVRVIKKAPLADLSIKEMEFSLEMSVRPQDLLERLEVDRILAARDEEISQVGLSSLTKELIYNYDYGDNWIVKISKYSNCQDLLDKNIIGKKELDEAVDIVVNKHKPVCINRVGLSVLDDVGGLSGFADFLGIIYEEEDKDEASYTRAWAKNVGWSARKYSIKNML